MAIRDVEPADRGGRTLTPAAFSPRSLQAAGLAAWAWWLGELRGMVPARWRGERRKRVDADITLAGDTWFVRDRFGKHYSLDSRNRPEVEHALAALKGRRKRGRVVVTVPLSRCFVRRTELPRAMLGRAGALLRSELDTATPFHSGAVHWDWHVTGPGAAPGTVALAQVILKRRDTDGVFARLAEAGMALVRIAVENDKAARPVRLPLDLLRQDDQADADARQMRKGRRVLAVAAALATLAVGPLAFSQQASTLATLDGELTEATEALALHPGLSRAPLEEFGKALSAKRTMPPTDVLLDRLAAALPSDSTLDHLFLDHYVLTIQGHTGSFKNLDRALAAAPLFSAGHNVVAPTADADRGSFAIRLKVRPMPVGPEA